MTFGERLVEIRKARGFTQKGLADKLGISPTRLNYWEKDKREPDVSMINNLCVTLEIKGNYLLGISDDEDNVLSHPPDKTIKKYHLLNADGKEKVNNYIDDLLQNDKNIAATSHTTDTITPFDKFAMDMVKKAMTNANPKAERIKANSIK